MESYPAPAREMVAALTAAAAERPFEAVAFQGAPGCNSHIAANTVFPGAAPLPCYSFEDALDAVNDGRAGRAMIPIENSLHGRVADIHFLLPESGLTIVGEHFMPIRYCLMGLGGAEIAEAMSHPQALGQCRHWLRAHGIKPVVDSDTAGAAAAVAELGNPAVGAIAPRLAAELYGLQILGEGLEDSDDNTTRFVILAREAQPIASGGPTMTSFTFEVKNVPAALYKALGSFATNGINMTKLESYQQGASFAATGFYCDVEGSLADDDLKQAFAELEFHTKWVRVLGTYPQERPRS
ncbi:prephenate dehydratase [Sphingomonas vulcanisoli]|uniref:prephenate dehydratase n=1 Tax=Sphingomonas vulcanisoli TaxID=1658060 RepID=A0ABX0TUX6_9SPHN|nr:prephenate dehydratase [Sphingomonas vulcanisoli]NIJ08270.1 prephenate dehydratase [Sphingomonas vulcanisoli]